jgi:DNA polymerase-4
MKRIILHIDMNSYFASCEQQANPFLRGKPVGVCAYLSKNGCIIASSIEAKKFGVKTGCRVFEAKQLCPEIILIENEPAKYRSITQKIFSILSDYTDAIEPYSIDEAFLDLTGFAHNFKEAKTIAAQINQRIKKEAGEWLKASIGISETRFLAKFASDIAEKDSILVIEKEKAYKFFDREVTDAWGINTRLQIRLNALGIFTLNDLRRYPVANLLLVFGKVGYYLWANVNGIELEGVKNEQRLRPKSVGHSYCLSRRTKDKNYLLAILLKLCEKTGRRLRKLECEAQTICFGFSYLHGGGFYKVKKLKNPVFETKNIFFEAKKLFLENEWQEQISFLAISLSNLIPLQNQASLFQDNLALKKLSLSMDQINDKYGEHTVFLGTMYGTEKYARDRIGFRKTIEVERGIKEGIEYLGE